MTDHRPTVRPLFYVLPKQLKVYFYTSNDNKYIQARTFASRFGLDVRHFEGSKEPYEEDYSAGRSNLLERAVSEVREKYGGPYLLFVEDTSVRIEALSDSAHSVPGLQVKEWFETTSFDELDRELRSHGDRTAVVRSDIALSVPGRDGRPIILTGETKGRVAETPPEFKGSVQYPWLNPDTFNGWFIPEGSESRLGEMSFEQSLRYDFRIKAFRKLVDRIDEYTAIANLPSGASEKRVSDEAPAQLDLINGERSVYVVVGYTCAGKTTFGERANRVHDIRFIEASGIVRMFRERSERDGLSMYDFAKKLLREKGPDIVARKICQLASDGEDALVITGLRTLEELAVIKDNFDNAKSVLIEASERSRYQRFIQRSRSGREVEEGGDIEQLRRIDRKQEEFGLLASMDNLAEVRVVNEGSSRNTLSRYQNQIDAVLTGGKGENVKGVRRGGSPSHPLHQERLYRCLRVMGEEGRPLTCEEIEERTRDLGYPIEGRNVNQALSEFSALADRIETEGDVLRYSITSAGRTYVSLREQRAEEVEDMKMLDDK